MSFRNQPRNRRLRRQSGGGNVRLQPGRLDLPGPLAFLTNPKLFVIVGVVMAAAIILSLFAGAFSTGTSGDDGVVRQGNELPDAPRETNAEGTSVPSASNPTAAVKRYTAPPPQVLEAGKRYTATIKTSQGDIQVELYADQAPTAVNTFVFLANDGYYNGTPFMQVTRNPDGSRFTAQAGDPTRTGLGTPGFEVRGELTSQPFTRGAIGMDSGQFFISYGDYPSLSGKYAIFGRVVSGLDVLDKLALLDVSRKDATASSDQVQSITVTAN